MAVGDFNGDGNADLAIVNNGNSSVSIFLGNGNGTFAAGQVYGVGVSPIGVTVADFNGDGKLDLVVAIASNASPSSVSVLLGKGDGTFGAPTNYGVGGTVGVAVGDFNGDGKLDLAVGHSGNPGPGYIAMLLGNGDGTFQQGPTSPSDNVPDSIGSADFNHDGKLDVMIGNYSTNFISVQLGKGDGTFGPATDYVVGSYPFSGAIGDFNGDGKPDLAIPNSAGNTLSILLGNGNGTFKPATTLTGESNPASVTVADFNGDGNLDLAVTNLYTVMVLLGNGNGTFAAGPTLPVSGGVGIGDFNDDGALDVAVSNPHLGSPTLNNVTAFINQRVQAVSTVSVIPAEASHFDVAAPIIAPAGTAASFTVTAVDPFGNTATDYSGRAFFTSSDSAATLPAVSVLANGVGTFSVTLSTLGDQTLIATDAIASSITGTSNTITVSGPATHFVLNSPMTATAGQAFNVTVTALDTNNVTAVGYSGTVNFTSSDSQAAVPSNVNLFNGLGIFAVTLKTVGSELLTASDTTSGIAAVSNNIAVSAAAASHLVLGVPSNSTAGMAFILTVTARDQFNNTATGYGGSVKFSSSDNGLFTTVPVANSLASGVGIFGATLTTAGSQTLTVTDNSNSGINGVSGPIIVSAAAAARFTVVAPPAATAGVTVAFTVTALDSFNNFALGIRRACRPFKQRYGC